MKKVIFMINLISIASILDSYASQAAKQLSYGCLPLPPKLAENELGESLSNLLGNIAYTTREQAQRYTSFDKNNMFSRREIVVIDWWPPKEDKQIQKNVLIYGTILGYYVATNDLLVQIHKTNNPQRPSIICKKTEMIGKMLCSLETQKNLIHAPPGGLAIQNDDDLPSYQEAIKHSLNKQI